MKRIGHKHKITALLAVLCMMLTMLPTGGIKTASAANGNLTGDGSEGAPYQISDADDLRAFAQKVNGGETGACAILTADIDLNPGVTFTESGPDSTATQWTPVGSSAAPYSGTFDGQGYTIRGLYIDSGGFNGLFSYIGESGVVKNTGIVNSLVISSTGDSGSFAASNHGTIENCYNTGIVKCSAGGLQSAGGIAASGEGTIKNCYNTGTVDSSVICGGIYGWGGIVVNCYNTGTLVCNVGNIGGIAFVCGSVTNSYYLDTCGAPDTNAHGTSLTADQFKDLANFSGWADSGEWKIDSALGRPVLTSTPEEDYYEISTAAELWDFAEKVNSGSVSINAKLMTDIDLNPGFTFTENGYTGDGQPQQWTPMGSSSAHFDGIFDGQGHTISGLYLDESSFLGLFAYAGQNSVIINTGIENSFVQTSSGDAGAVAAKTFGRVENCYNAGTVRNTASGRNSGGGVVGSIDIGGSVSNCFNAGEVYAAGFGGGVVGFTDGSIRKCYNAGRVSGSQVGAITWGDLSGSADVDVCYYLEGTASTGVYNGNVWGGRLTQAQMTGEAAQTNLAGFDFTNTWGVKDASVSEGEPGETSETVNVTSYFPYLKIFGENSAQAASQTETTRMKQENGYYLVYTADQLREFAALVNGTLSAERRAVYGVTGADSDANAMLLADIDLNPGFTFDENGYSGDGEPQQWTPMGSSSLPYTGIFDGNGKTISGIYIHNTGANNQGVFGYISGGAVKNLITANGHILGNGQTGGIIGYADNTEIMHCINENAVANNGNTVSLGGIVGIANNATVQYCANHGRLFAGGYQNGGIVGSATDSVIEQSVNYGNITVKDHAAGIAAYNTGGTVKNCMNFGDVSTTNTYYTYTAGIVANNRETDSTVENCLNFGSIIGRDADAIITQNDNYGTLAKNCYSLEGSCESLGRVDNSNCRFLNSAQLIGAAAKENLNGFDFTDIWGTKNDSVTNSETSVTYETVTLAYYYPYLQIFGENSALVAQEKQETRMKTETDVEGNDYYLVYNADQLKEFAALVNGTLSSEKMIAYGVNGEEPNANGKLMADIDLNPEFIFFENGTYTGSGTPQQWTPIGNAENQYTGVFDGDGHVIIGLYINTQNDSQGLFGYLGSGGVIKSTGITNGYIGGGKMVGAVAGNNFGSDIINCYNAGTVNGSEKTGGIAGNQSGGSITTSYNAGEVSASSKESGGIAGYNMGEIDSCYNIADVTAGAGYCGGIAGNNGDYGYIRNSYNTGSVNGASNNSTGAVAGYNSNVISDCFYLDSSAEGAVGSISGGSAKALTLAQIEDTGEDGLLAQLDVNGNGSWNTQLSAVSSWEYGKPVLQPVLFWQNIEAPNAPTYTVTIPENVNLNESGSITIRAEAGGMTADQQVQVAVSDSEAFELTLADDNTVKLGYTLKNEETQIAAGDVVLATGNTAPGAEVSAALTVEPDAVQYSGAYAGTLTLTISLKEVQSS